MPSDIDRTAARQTRWILGLSASLLIAILWGAEGSSVPPPALGWEAESASASPEVLVFSATAGFRHGSIPDGIAAVEWLGAEHDFAVTATEDAAVFSDEGLEPFGAVVFLNTTGDILDEAQQAAFERYIQAGGGFVGVHSASDTEYGWPWYGELMGAWFARHPRVQPAIIERIDGEHSSTRHLPERWERRDEWYDFRRDPSEDVEVLLRLDESSYEGGGMGASHPIAWYHEFDGGRAWYTALGHTNGTYAEPEFLDHLLGGIQWAMGPEQEGMGATIYLPRLATRTIN